MESALVMRNICKRFPGVQALDHVDFSVNKGEIHALVGQNGAGKSTLMKVLAGAIRMDQGEIYLNGKKIELKEPLDAQALGISIIYQEFNLIPYLTAPENIFLGHPIKNQLGILNWKQVYDKAQQILDRLGINIDLKIPVSHLGIAQQQLIEIAKALSIDAHLIIMDEPTAALSTEEINKLFEVVIQLKSQGVSIIFITHHIKEIFEIADRASIMRDGKMVGIRDVVNLNETELVQMMIGRSLKESVFNKSVKSSEVVLSVRNLSRQGILHNINFDLYRGEILGIAGLMGSGRTELVRAIFGADAIDTGDIIVKNQKVTIRSPKDAIKNGVGLAPEDRKTQGLILKLPVLQNITLPFIKKLLNGITIKFKKERNKVEQIVSDLKINTPSVNQKVVNLSGGNQQKIVLGKWLGSEVDIYLFDEPTRGIDVGAKEEFYNLIQRLTAEGASAILISSELEEVIRMSDRVIVMHLGKITGEFSRENLNWETLLLCAMGKQLAAGVGK